MSEVKRDTNALPCIICGSTLENVSHCSDDEHYNQPYGGTTFTTHGHYGSTAFDPMDGTFLEINLCDECLILAAERNAVYTSRSSRPVFLTDAPGGPVIVGWEYVRRNLAYWKHDMDGTNERRSFTRSEIVKYANNENFSWNIPIEQMLGGYEQWESEN